MDGYDHAHPEHLVFTETVICGESLPRSFAQIQVWLEEQLEPSLLLPVVACLRIRGEVDRPALRDELGRLVALRDGRRTTSRVGSSAGRQPLRTDRKSSRVGQERSAGSPAGIDDPVWSDARARGSRAPRAGVGKLEPCADYSTFALLERGVGWVTNARTRHTLSTLWGRGSRFLAAVRGSPPSAREEGQSPRVVR